MLQLNLKDKTLYYLGTNRYQNSLVSDRIPQYWEWVKDRPELPTYYTYMNFEEVEEIGEEQEKNAILLESSAIVPNHVNWLYQNATKFKTIYTHNSFLLSLPNARWIPGGGCWIGTEFGGGELKVYDKTKLVSFMSSGKAMCPLHIMRHTLANYCQVYLPYINIYGMGGPFVKAASYLTDYRFSIILENYVDKCYFTEKILNCFATGTIPIYLGAKTLPFNEEGIIRFNSPEEFLPAIKKATPEFYEANRKAVEENLELCKKYLCIEDYMWENYSSEIFSSYKNKAYHI